MEEAPSTGTHHIQGYGELTTQTAVRQVGVLLGGRAHVASARGTMSENLLYCTKAGSLDFEHGSPREPGKRSDLVNVRVAATVGGMRAVTEGHYNYQAIRLAEKYLVYHDAVRSCKPVVTWLYGPTGTGKSRMARAVMPLAYWKDSTKWWEGYDGHKEVVIDDYRGDWWSLTYLLRLLDRYPVRVECKGGSRQFLAENIIITSCVPPDYCFRTTDEDMGQLLRRIDFVVPIEAPLYLESEGTQESGVIVEAPTHASLTYSELEALASMY